MCAIMGISERIDPQISAQNQHRRQGSTLAGAADLERTGEFRSAPTLPVPLPALKMRFGFDFVAAVVGGADFGVGLIVVVGVWVDGLWGGGFVVRGPAAGLYA